MDERDGAPPLERPLRALGAVLGTRTKTTIALAAVVAGALALLETAALVTVLPLVDVATGAPVDEGIVGMLWRALGSPGRAAFGLMLVLAVVLLFIVKDVCTMAFTWWQSGFVARERVALSVRIYRRIMLSPYVEFRRRSSGEAFRTMTAAVGEVFRSMVGGLITLISGGLTVLAIVLALVITAPLQAAIALAYFGAAALAYSHLVRPRMRKAGELMMQGSVESTIAGLQGLNGFKEAKIRNSSEYFVERFSRGITLTERASREGNFYSSITKYLLEIVFVVGVGILLAVSFATGAEQDSIGSLALFVAAGFRLLPNLSQVVGAVNGFKLGQESLAIVRDELREELSPRPAEIAGTRLPFEKELQLEDVRFRYPGAREDVVRGVDLTIPFGRSIAFVGGSGAGKTTLVDLILGLLEPRSGTIRADGVDVGTDLRAWQRNVAMVAQDVFLTEESVRQNILFDIPAEQADEDRLRSAVEKAQLADVAAQLPEGLDSSAGEWGARLSGGQRQRVGIARALYLAPRLLVLDEATSALDNDTERRITDTIAALNGEVTVIVVAHRLSTVKDVDEIVFLKDGRIAGRGSFARLQQENADFAHLVKLGDLG